MSITTFGMSDVPLKGLFSKQRTSWLTNTLVMLKQRVNYEKGVRLFSTYEVSKNAKPIRVFVPQ